MFGDFILRKKKKKKKKKKKIDHVKEGMSSSVPPGKFKYWYYL